MDKKTRQYLAFDLEIAKPLPGGQADWTAYHPLGITCAATHTGDSQPRVWYSRNLDGTPASQMNREELIELVDYLQTMVVSGHTLLTWNGLGFDFNVLAEESGLWKPCAEMAIDHVDMMFQVFCMLGHTLGLDKAARGMGVPGKPPGMSGALAPRYWAEGKWAIVLDYVAQDARTTLALAQAVEAQSELRWISDRGIRQNVRLPNGWLTVREALKLPEPDISWLQRPMQRSKFTGWLSNLEGS
jgi:hypothetical protein